jgi:hypothetical protein
MDKFEKWIMEAAPEVPINEMKKEIHLWVLRERLREKEILRNRRHKRQRRASMVAVLLVFFLYSGNVSELGSDGFEITMFEIDGGLKSISGHRETYVPVYEEDTAEEILDLHQQIEARIGWPVSVDAYGFEGAIQWTISYEYQVGEEKRLYTETVLGRPSVLTREMQAFMLAEGDKMMEQAEEGILVPVETREEEVEETLFLLKFYEYESENYGIVKYIKGEPIR